MIQSHLANLNQIDSKARQFYCEALGVLTKAKIPFLVGGAYAFERYTGIARHTKDLDLFLRPRDCKPALEAFRNFAGYSTEMRSPHWLAKAFCGDYFVDIIFSSANGYFPVDDIWFERAPEEEVLGMPVRICPAEEIICSKAFVMARDRFDGADIAHLIRACSYHLDWAHLLGRFGSQWRVLFSHLILFEFIYPAERARLPDWVLRELLNRFQEEMNATPATEPLCQGTLLAPLQYLIDVERWGYGDARLRPWGNLTSAEIAQWTEALEKEKAEKCH